ncbi:unnamed protein product [Phytomonas sp. Hart1]|nr:unnamed protein product [Phytomonas sp. Hart1]|eukprot:CCW68943.1 unnamed protein product [Phytomonas sp. isolate Hart1]
MSLDKMLDLQLQLKFTAKQFSKNSIRCEKEQKSEMNKCKKAIEKNNLEGARIYAENCIRKKNEALNNLRLSARIDAVVSRLETAIKTKMVMKNMGQMVRGMEVMLKTMDPAQIGHVMEGFEKHFETMDVTSTYMQEAIGDSVATTTPEDEVSHLIAQVADAHGLDLKVKFDDKLRINDTKLTTQAPEETVQDKEMVELEEQFERLRRR